MQRHARWFVLFLLLVSSSGLARSADDPPRVARGATEEMVPMRDGVSLATNVFLPRGEGPWPVILTRTPYSKDGLFGAMAPRYVSAGYVFVIQDCRGRFRSEGEYRPFEDDLNDGFDTVNWVAGQPWCDGNVGMSGASAMGITSLLAAISQPEALKAAFVVVAPESFWSEATFIGGVFKQADVGNWMESQGAADQVAERKASLIDTEDEAARDLILHRHKIQIPIYHLGGWYDIFSTGTQGNFAFLQNHGDEGARGQQKLYLGPFGHGNLAGELRYKGDKGILGVFSEEIRWFNHHLKGEDNGVMDEPPVKYFQMASAHRDAPSPKNEWRTLDNWPPESTATSFYAAEGGALQTSPVDTVGLATRYTFDPAQPVPTVGGANLTLPIGPLDQRAIADRDDYLRFQTPPLENDVAIAGPVYVDLYCSTDGPDTDFVVKLVDVYPDGYEALLLDAPIRCMFRDGHAADEIKPMQPDEPTKIRIPLGGIANTFEQGHSIALHVTSSNYPRFEVNPNTGELPGQQSKPPRTAQNAVYHDKDYPTALVLPVVE